MSKDEVTLIAVGDVLIDREVPESIFAHTVEVLRSGDITFAQLEQMYSEKGHPHPMHATYSHLRNIPALTYAGLNVVSLAGNHTLDWGPEALVDTIDRLREAGLTVIGVGRNIAEARQPAIVERNGTRVAFLAYGCIGPDGYEADEDRPGYAPMRAHTLYKQVDYQPGTPPKIFSFPYKEDLEAMVADIQAARARADVVVVSYHWGIHFTPAVIPMYAFEVGHTAVDAGADLILGHHAHILKGAEVYKGKVIFHSLANFALEIGPNTRRGVARPMRWLRELYDFQPDPEYPTYPMHPEAKATLIAKAVISGGQIRRVSFLPCWVNKQAEPEVVSRHHPHGEEVRQYMEKISRHQKLTTSYTWEGDEVVITG